jgi:hypothetical protein
VQQQERLPLAVFIDGDIDWADAVEVTVWTVVVMVPPWWLWSAVRSVVTG